MPESLGHRWISQSLIIAGAAILVERRGCGDPILLAHGIPGDSRTLKPVAELLADRFETIVPSLPIKRAEDRPERPFGTEGMRDDLADIISSMNYGSVHLVAWSYSAHAALALAIDRPELVASLLIYEPGFPTFLPEGFLSDTVQADTLSAFGPIALRLAEGDTMGALRLAIDEAAMQCGYFDAQPEHLQQVHIANADTLGQLFTQTAPVSLTDCDLLRIACPVTVARGTRTRPCYQIVSDFASALINRRAATAVVGAGHLFPEQHPAHFAELIQGHIEHSRQ